MKPIISAHRGAADMAPENTMPAIAKAIELGIPMIELDVRSSLDGVLYDLHDPTVTRTTNGKGPIRLMGSSRIDRLNAEDKFFCEYQKCHVPRIEDILAKFGGRVQFYFDVKKGVRLKTLLDLVYKYNLRDRSLFWFKDSAMAARMKRIDPELKLKINVSGPEDLLQKEALLPPDFIEISPDDYSETLHYLCRARDIKIMINFLNEEERFIKKPKKWPVDIVNVHRVLPMIPYLKKQNMKKADR